MKETWKLDPQSGWTRCADMNQDRRRHCATFVDDTSMYVLGGQKWEKRKILDSIEKYDVKTDAWAVVGNLRKSTCLAACAVFDESIYVFGGRCTEQKDRKDSLNYVQVFDTASEACSILLQRLPSPMQTLRAVTWNGNVIIAARTKCVVFDFRRKTFRKRNRFASGVNRFGLVLENGRVYLAAGGGHSKADGRVRSIAAREIVDNVLPVDWTHHADLPQGPLQYVDAFAVMSWPRQTADEPTAASVRQSHRITDKLHHLTLE